MRYTKTSIFYIVFINSVHFVNIYLMVQTVAHSKYYRLCKKKIPRYEFRYKVLCVMNIT